MKLERNSWKVARRIGVGDRELVRAGLLQVGCFCNDDLEIQIAAGLDAAKRLHKTLRVYYNAARLSDSRRQGIVNGLMRAARDHDPMPEINITPERFKWVLGRCDLIITPIGLLNGRNQKQLSSLIIDAWNESGGRDWKLAARRQTEEKTRELFPELYADDDELWKQFSGV